MGWQPRVRRCALNGAEKADWQPLFPSSAFTMCVRKTHRQATHFGRPPMVVVLARAERTSLDLVANHQCSSNLGFPDLSISFHTCIACRNVLFMSALNTSACNGLFFPSILGTLSPFCNWCNFPSPSSLFYHLDSVLQYTDYTLQLMHTCVLTLMVVGG